MKLSRTRTRSLFLSVILLMLSTPLAAQDATGSAESAAISAQVVSPEAQAVLDRMTAYLQASNRFHRDQCDAR